MTHPVPVVGDHRIRQETKKGFGLLYESTVTHIAPLFHGAFILRTYSTNRTLCRSRRQCTPVWPRRMLSFTLDRRRYYMLEK